MLGRTCLENVFFREELDLVNLDTRRLGSGIVRFRLDNLCFSEEQRHVPTGD